MTLVVLFLVGDGTTFYSVYSLAYTAPSTMQGSLLAVIFYSNFVASAT